MRLLRTRQERRYDEMLMALQVIDRMQTLRDREFRLGDPDNAVWFSAAINVIQQSRIPCEITTETKTELDISQSGKALV